jgi:hypothetical protein
MRLYHFFTCFNSLKRADSPIIALNHILSAISLCQKLKLDSLLASATIVLGKIHLRMGFPLKAVDTIQNLFPQVCDD